jgi:hypothetical protein
MNINNWNYYYKYSDFGKFKGIAQTTYEPLVNPEGTVFCANYNINSLYHVSMGPRPLYTENVVDWFFNNEVKNLEHFAKKTYAPEVLDIDFTNKRIFFKWYKHMCNDSVYSGHQWPKEWMDQLKHIMLDQLNEGYYKLTMYSHCHYIADNGDMKAIDWYGCLPKDNPLVPKNCMDAIIHDSAKSRLEETGPATNGYYNMETMFKRGLEEHVLWGHNNLKFIHDEIFKS